MFRFRITGSAIAVAFFLLLLIAGCSANANSIGAPEITYGMDVCEECGMLIDNPQYAAATLDTKSNAHIFDDIGGMIVFHMDHPEHQVRAYFVHEYHTQAWLRGETAFYVKSSQLQAPMGDAIVAFAERGAAELFAQEVNGVVFEFDELRINVHVTLHAMQ